MELYKTAKKPAFAQIVEKRSRFIGYIKPVKSEEEALEFLNSIRSKHWDAKHNVYAYSLRDNSIMRFSDDNEPSKTAGMPVLDVLKKNEITDCIIVVTRYFGGTLLGTGGLVRAYSAAAKAALDASGVVIMQRCCVYTLECTYTSYSKISTLIQKYDGEVDSNEFAENVIVKFHIPDDKFVFFNNALSELTNGSVFAKRNSEDFFAKKE